MSIMLALASVVSLTSPSVEQMCGPATDFIMSGSPLDTDAVIVQYKLRLERTLDAYHVKAQDRPEARNTCLVYLIGARRALREIQLLPARR